MECPFLNLFLKPNSDGKKVCLTPKDNFNTLTNGDRCGLKISQQNALVTIARHTPANLFQKPVQ